MTTHLAEKKLDPIVFLARKLDLGGAERQLVVLAKELQKMGHKVCSILFYNGGEFDQEMIRNGIPVYYLNKTHRWDIIGFLWKLMRRLRQLRPGTVYSLLDVPNVMAVLLKPVVGKPRIVWSIRAAFMEMSYYDWLMRLIPAIENYLSHKADCIVANSYAGREWAIRRGFPSGKILVIENGIDTQYFRPNPVAGEQVRKEWGIRPEEFLIGMVGRLDPMKDHSTFLRACALVLQEVNNIRIVCVGGGSEADLKKLKSLAHTLNIESRLLWAGPRKDMPAVYNSLNLLVSSSSFGEGFPNVVAEAMGCGVPCVVTDVGDSGRIVGGLGEVVPPKSPEALAEGIIRMLERIKKEPWIKNSVRRRIQENFSVERMVESFEKALD